MRQEVLAPVARWFVLIVHGVPSQQGSKRAFTNPVTGRPIVVDDNPKTLRPWRSAIVSEARTAMALVDAHRPFEAAKVNLQFYFQRPQSHYGARGQLLPSAPRMKATEPDLDKLVRAVYDALKDAGVVRNDARIVESSEGKHWADPGMAMESPGLLLRISELL